MWKLLISLFNFCLSLTLWLFLHSFPLVFLQVLTLCLSVTGTTPRESTSSIIRSANWTMAGTTSPQDHSLTPCSSWWSITQVKHVNTHTSTRIQVKTSWVLYCWCVFTFQFALLLKFNLIDFLNLIDHFLLISSLILSLLNLYFD